MSEHFNPDTVNLEGLERLMKALKQKPPRARVGILGSKAERGDSGPSNADIGAVHEYGSFDRGIPQRSFLRMPLNERLQKEMGKAGAFTEETAANVLKQGSLKPWVEKAAVVAVAVVAEAFDSGGFGRWAPHAPGYTNNTGMILVDTTQLRDSISYDIKGGS